MPVEVTEQEKKIGRLTKKYTLASLLLLIIRL